jgi:hypothetical protein
LVPEFVGLAERALRIGRASRSHSHTGRSVIASPLTRCENVTEICERLQCRTRFHNSECLSEGDNDAPETRAANRQVVDTRPDAPLSRVLGNVRHADVSSHTRKRCIAIGRVMA